MTTDDIKSYIDEVGTYNNAVFYKWIRKEKDILMNKDKPINGKWSYDTENREPFPKNFSTDVKLEYGNSKYEKEAYDYIDKYFKNNLGDVKIYLPITHEDAKKHLMKFLKYRLDNFGKYEDACSENINFGYHSILSAMLNIGLISPIYVIEQTTKYINKVSYASIEGFVRQIVSWREYVRMLYQLEHKKFIKDNFFNHKRHINKSWYDGTTGIAPIDHLIKKALNLSYLHHIERLMHIGNFMLLNMFSPKEVLEWFISVVSIDAYQWVMEPNVYGMSQFSVGNLMMTRPYFSSSNYIDKMSTFKKKKTNMIK